MKDRNIICTNYIAHNQCSLGKPADFYGYCQKCSFYEKKINTLPARVNRKKEKIEKAKKRERWFD